jgi:hypothetical protein
MATDLTVATTILEQLGGGRFIVMTGAKDFIATADERGGLAFRLPSYGGEQRVRHMAITLTEADLYTVQAFSGRGPALAECDRREGVYADTLRDVFTRMTGLAVSL